MTDATASLALDTRAGWPTDLRHLADRYPRETWTGHANLGEMARFWLSRHDMFREIAGSLEQASAAFREGTATADDLRAWFPPTLQFFLRQLHAHHQVEDLHFFPVFQAAEARLARGFEVLEADHRVIHEAIAGKVDAANAFIRAPAGAAGIDALRGAGESYAGAADALTARLGRHLRDEEDLIIPLILDRGERTLGLA